jgi:hypothetical protein
MAVPVEEIAQLVEVDRERHNQEMPWHPRWCQARWCTAWTPHHQAVHRSDPVVFTRADDHAISVYVCIEAYPDGSDPEIRIVAPEEAGGKPWWDPEKSYEDGSWPLAPAERLYRALGPVAR